MSPRDAVARPNAIAERHASKDDWTPVRCDEAFSFDANDAARTLSGRR